ncbi:MAG TPA: SDR family oxidoreductase [Dehalococcoidia bacterium]|nr:SDR family oxidoreductase [Dehalococcoidia bacterium]
MNRLAGKVAVVTGAGSGNGRAIARAFVAEGARVLAADLNEAAAKASVADLGDAARAQPADVTRDADCARLMQSAADAFGRLDILVNNAGIWKSGTVETLSPADWEQLMAVNVTGVFLCSKHALPRIAAAGGGSIVNLASLAGLAGAAGGVLYHASKHAVVGMTKCMALDHAAQRIRVNAICPGAIDTPMLQSIIEQRGSAQGRSADELRERYRRSTPLGRIGTPEDVAQIAVHLASDEAEWVTGMCYTLDGGSGITQRR